MFCDELILLTIQSTQKKHNFAKKFICMKLYVFVKDVIFYHRSIDFVTHYVKVMFGDGKKSITLKRIYININDLKSYLIYNAHLSTF
jgi:hypothetical protein